MPVPRALRPRVRALRRIHRGTEQTRARGRGCLAAGGWRGGEEGGGRLPATLTRSYPGGSSLPARGPGPAPPGCPASTPRLSREHAHRPRPAAPRHTPPPCFGRPGSQFPGGSSSRDPARWRRRPRGVAGPPGVGDRPGHANSWSSSREGREGAERDVKIDQECGGWLQP